ncbi:MAG: methyltransferase domain-containing protein [Pyrinomonadaceae bacterium]|nr:methyltransferase domain-containing protein [Pyrinomonadaceae bacterium]
MTNDKKDNFIPALSFDFLTSLYDPVVALTTREKEFKRELVRQIDLRPMRRILDLACGTATVTIALKQSCPQAEVFGLDGDAKILHRARQKIEKSNAKIALSVGLSNEMPYPDNYFDTVVSSLFFHHLTPDSKRKTLAEIRRVLKAGGTLHVADWGKPANLLMKVASLPVQWLDGATTKDSYQEKLPELMAEAGFKGIVETAAFDTVFGTIRLH